MRILQLTSHLEVGGISTYVVNLSEALVNRGHQVMVASDRGLLETRLSHNAIPHRRLPLHTSVELSSSVAWSGWQLSRKLSREPVDLIHAHTRVSQVIAHWLWKRHKIPYLTTWHGFYRRRIVRRWWPCTGLLTVAISQQVRQHLIDMGWQAEDRIRLIYHGVDVNYFTEVPDVAALQAYRMRWPSEQRFVIGNVGRLASGGVKGFDVLLAAVQLARHQLANIEVVLVGDGPRRPFLEREAERLGIKGHVHFLGATDDVRVPLALMDVFVFSSRWPEAFGLSLIEAMAMGRPVVATRTGAVPEIIEHGKTGWLVPPDDPVALAEGIVRLLKDPATAAQFGRQAQARVREVFNHQRMVDQVEAVYEELLARYVPRRHLAHASSG